jgi:hypothetical protein
MANISILDRINGTYSVMATGVTAQNEELSSAPSIPNPPALPAPSFYGTWSEWYYAGNK